MKKRYKQACDLWFSKEVSKEMMVHIEYNYGFEDDEMDDEQLQDNVLCLFKDVYFEEKDLELSN